ncbi:MAG: hypothetical protein ACYS1A_11745 [Planctomycetota bacterium]|jgi:hypothetical protein
MNNSILMLMAASVLIFTAPTRAQFTEPDNSGLASKYLGDAGIENDPNVIFTENFEEGSVPAVTSRWEDITRSDIMSLVTDVPVGTSGENALLITHTGGDGTGAALYRRLSPVPYYSGYDQLYFRFYTKFDPNCHPIHHFVRMGGYEDPKPWALSHLKFATAIDPHHDTEPVWRWDFYTYWEEMRLTYGNRFISDENLTAEKDKWICVEFMMKMNDPVTQRNGEQSLWIDGKLWQRDGQIITHLGEGFPNGYWTGDTFNPDPAGSPFEGFLWRTTEEREKLNWIWLSLYISNAPNGYISRVWFDDVVVATEYIGPINATDFNISGKVDLADYAALALRWQDQTCDEPTWCGGTDLNKSGSINLDDLAQFADSWLLNPAQ